MPPKNKKKPKQNPTDGNKKKPAEVYEVHRESFEGKPVFIVCRSLAGECPLLGLCNLLLLRYGVTTLIDTVRRTDGTTSVSAKKLQAFVLDLLTVVLSQRVEAGILTNQEKNDRLIEYQAQLDELRSDTGIFEIFTSVDDVYSSRTASKDLFLPLGVTRRHALLPDPKDTPLYTAVKDQCSAALLFEFSEYEAGCGKGVQYKEKYHHKMSLVKEFAVNGPQFNSYGLGRLREEAPEKELFLLLIFPDLCVVYKREGELYLLVTKEDMRVKYPDIMWLSLDENFNAENLETARKLTSTFSPINENWVSASSQILQELEEEKRGCGIEVEKVVSQKVAETCDSHKVAETCDNHKVAETDSQKVAETKLSKIVVEHRFLRFVHRRVVSFQNFTSSYMMFKTYKFKKREFGSTSHLGRLTAKGFVVFIFDAHKRGYSWNGGFTEKDMFVELEVIDGSFIGTINCFINLTPNKDFKKEHGEADLEQYVQILFPHYLCEGHKELPSYFLSFESDIADLPDSSDPAEKLENFHRYMSDHFFGKAPLARSTLVSSVHGLCDSEIVHIDQSMPKPRYAPLDVSLLSSRPLNKLQMSLPDPLNQVYLGSRVETHVIESNRWTCWDAIELGRHSKQHMMEKTQENGVQQIQDPVIIDLIIEEDLMGLLTEAIKLMFQKNNFGGRFESTWQEFCGSEPKDDGARIPLRFQEEDVEIAEEPEEKAMQAAATVATTEPVAQQQPERFIVNDYGMMLTEKGLKSVDGENWIIDEVIDFVYCELSNEVMSLDFVLVPSSLAHSLTNLPGDSDPSDIFDPLNSNIYLFPLNNSKDHEQEDSGTHWSLVVLHVDRSHNKCIFVHYDSIRNMNRDAADRLVGNLEKLFPTFHSRSIEGQTPPQLNTYDCGMYVIAISFEIATWYKKVKKGQKAADDGICDVSKVTSEKVRKRRQQLYVNLKKKFQLSYPGYFEAGAVE